MNTLSAGYTLDFLHQRQISPFKLACGDELGCSPLQVRPKVVGYWSRNPDRFGGQIQTTLTMTQPGVQRIRLYCSEAIARSARLIVHEGEAVSLGRRQEEIIETLTWTRKQNQSLRYPHDAPSARVVDQTRFFNGNGMEVDPPIFLQNRGLFHHAQEVTGALVVAYQPGFTLFEVTYGLGEGQMTPERLREMKLAWLAGNIRDCDIPPVRVIALAEGYADQLTFPRRFWPEGALGRRGYALDAPPPNRDSLWETRDTCWERCWQSITGGVFPISSEQYRAIEACVESAQQPTHFQYVETDRKTKVEKIFHPDDAEIYVEVERPVTLTMRLERADGHPFCDREEGSYPYLPELVFRFNG